MQMLKRIIFLGTLFFSISAFATESSTDAPAPWFTGPLLAPAGTTLPPGTVGLQPYVFYTADDGVYNHRWQKEGTLETETLNPVIVMQVGLSSHTELDFAVPYQFNYRNGQSSDDFGDMSVTFGYQLMKGVLHTWKPDLRINIGETFPTGTYENLNPAKNGTDSMGAGSYQTAVAATLQKLWELSGHYLRGRLNLTYTMPSQTDLHGFNAYGGTGNTDGTMNGGNHFSADLAGEYAITRHWVPAIDILYNEGEYNVFHGNVGTTVLGLPAEVSLASTQVLSLAPALEYNFNADLGLIAGVWFTVAGRESTDFTSYVVSLVATLG